MVVTGNSTTYVTAVFLAVRLGQRESLPRRRSSLNDAAKIKGFVYFEAVFPGWQKFYGCREIFFGISMYSVFCQGMKTYIVTITKSDCVDRLQCYINDLAVTS